VAFTEAEGPLTQLLAEYGPPTKSSPGYPFHHLASDGLWVVRTEDGGGSPGPNLGALRANGAKGELAPEFADTLHADIAAQVGLDLMPAVGGASSPAAPKRRRSLEFRDHVLMAYELRCAMCGFDGRLGAETVGLEAAHVRWFNIGGPDTVENGLCLCALHHKLLDKGAIGISTEHTVVVSARFVGVGRSAEEFVLSLAGRELAEPLAGVPAIAEDHITWHTDQVFRAPARQAS
jgi:putative restriction endonuclease